jgi:RNA recognition motif-containing protein
MCGAQPVTPALLREDLLAVRLFIGNLPYDTTDAELRAHLGAIAPPSEVVLPIDRETGRPRGFAFVEFIERPVAEEVIRRFNAQPFKGRSLAVSEARAREDRPAGFRPSAPFRPAGAMSDGPSTAPGERPARNFGPPAPRRQKGGPARRPTKVEARPRGPIPERNTGRVFDVDDGEADTEDFDNFATSASEAEGDDQE